MMYQCGRCGLSRASSQEPIGSVLPQCKCPWEFTPPVMPQQRTWVGLTDDEKLIFAIGLNEIEREQVINDIEAKLKEKNT